MKAALSLRVIVSLAGLAAFGAGLVAYARGTAPAGDNLVLAGVALIVAAALSRRYGIALPGNGFSSYVVGVMLLAMLDRGWAFAAVVAPFAMFVGDILLRRLPVRAALNNAGHLTVGTTLVGLMYDRMDGQTGAAALTSNNLGLVVLVIVLLPIVVNGTFYLDLALGKTMAWVDARLTLRWETIIYLTSVGLALGWLALTHAAMPSGPTALVAAGLVVATVGSAYVIRLGVHADELRLVQRLAQAIAAEMSLTRSFTRVQELTRQLVPWEQMGFARYDARARQMELLADTAARPDTVFRFDADAGLTSEAVRLHHAVVAHGLAKDQVIVPGAETPGAEMLVPLYHAGQLVGLWSVRHSDPAMYRNSDGELLELLAPQLALMVAIEGSLRPVTGASDQTTQYVQTLTATTEEIHASSEEVAASAQRASEGAAQAATLVTAAAREAEQLKERAGELASAGDRTRDAGAQMEKTAEKVRVGTQGAVRQLTDLGATTEESAAEVRRLRDVAAQVEKFAEESGREARNVGKSVQDTRRALDRAAQLLERIRGDLGEVVQNSADWVKDLDRIAEAAAETARAGKRVADVGRQSAELAARITQTLGQARTAAQTSTQEAEAVAGPPVHAWGERAPLGCSLPRSPSSSSGAAAIRRDRCSRRCVSIMSTARSSPFSPAAKESFSRDSASGPPVGRAPCALSARGAAKPRPRFRTRPGARSRSPRPCPIPRRPERSQWSRPPAAASPPPYMSCPRPHSTPSR